MKRLKLLSTFNFQLSTFLFAFCLLPFAFLSCSKGKILEERHKFEKIKWNRFENQNFTAEIKNADDAYNLTLLFRHHTIYPERELFLTFTVYSPDGERRFQDFHVPVKNPDGSFIASGAGDLWDLEFPLYTQYQFNKPGKYRFEFENRMPKYDTEGVLELGLRIEKTP